MDTRNNIPRSEDANNCGRSKWVSLLLFGVSYNMTKEDRIIENMTEAHHLNLDRLEDRMESYVELKEFELSKACTDKDRKKIQGRIDRYLDWYDDMVQQIEDSFQERLERRLKTRRENMRN